MAGGRDSTRATIRPTALAHPPPSITHFISVMSSSLSVTQHNCEELKYPQDIFHNTILTKALSIQVSYYRYRLDLKKLVSFMNNNENNIVELSLFAKCRIFRYFCISNILLRTAEAVTIDTSYVILSLIM
jgi:hypothetical protein